MKKLDLNVGRSLEEKLCTACRDRLKEVITKKDVLRAVTVHGYKRLLRKIGDNSCVDCQNKIWGR